MGRPPASASEIDEQLLIAHNIACAASIIAVTKGIQPQGCHVVNEMDKILHDVAEAYKYSIWRLDKYDPHIILDIVNVRQQSLWSKPVGQD